MPIKTYLGKSSPKKKKASPEIKLPSFGSWLECFRVVVSFQLFWCLFTRARPFVPLPLSYLISWSGRVLFFSTFNRCCQSLSAHSWSCLPSNMLTPDNSVCLCHCPAISSVQISLSISKSAPYIGHGLLCTVGVWAQQPQVMYACERTGEQGQVYPNCPTGYTPVDH